jgi:integrase
MPGKRRARRGGGSVYYDANAKRWAAVVTVTDPDTGRRSRRKMTTPDSRQAAERLLKQMIAERDKTGRVSRKDITVGDVLDRFLSHPPAGWKSPTTRRLARQHAARLKVGLGSVRLSKLSAGQVEEHLRREITGDRPLARRTARDQLTLLRRAIRRAEQHDLVDRNVALLADMPAGAVTRRSGSMTVAQARQLLDSDLTPFWRAWLTVAIMTGLRPGEIGALSWEDVGDGVLNVRHSLHESPKGLVPGPLKTEQSRRTLAMPQAVAEVLAAWGAEQLAAEQLAGRSWVGTGLIFTDGFGRPVGRQKIHHGFRQACKRAGITRPDGRPFQPRELRHTFVSVLSAAGQDIEVISDAVGHINSGVTRTVYAHEISGKIQATATVMDTIFEAGAQP